MHKAKRMEGECGMESIRSGLLLNDYDVVIHYTDDYDCIIAKLERSGCPYDLSQNGYCRVHSKCFSCEITFWIAFQFCGKKLIKISLLPVSIQNDQKSYAKLQAVLKKQLGGVSIFQYLHNFANPAKRFKWSIPCVTIMHTLYDGFGYEDVISIRIDDDGAYSV